MESTIVPTSQNGNAVLSPIIRYSSISKTVKISLNSLFSKEIFTVVIGSEKCYDFGVFDLHHYDYGLWPINLIAAWGSDIIEARPIPPRDEDYLSGDYPKRIRKRIVCFILRSS